VQRRGAHHLHVERPLVQHTPGGLTGHREGLRQQFVERFAVGVALLKLLGLRTQFGVGQLLDVLGQGANIVRYALEAFDHATFAKAQQLRQHGYVPLVRVSLRRDLRRTPW